ncbi:LuxR C-terminal-related transcriptional regulator [Legionella pneumophila serogroup 1]|uniref:LuxR C-terminal-related transcriptional regulator n=1 Tax=Legionella TaxID=445 RepID=UPI00034642E4|nr:LuxR C-terminal-related transcriptional regulator [Legionella anisa]
MDLVVEGRLNKQIAYELNISTSTVEAHRAKVMRKLKVKTLTELIKISLLHAHEPCFMSKN